MSSVHQGGLAHNKYVALEARAILLPTGFSFQHSMTPLTSCITMEKCRTAEVKKK